MNSLSWIVAHLANQEQFYWLYFAQGKVLHPDLDRMVGYGQPATTPGWEQVWTIWLDVTGAADPFLDSLTTESLAVHLERDGEVSHEDVGTRLLRNIYHYWFHLGEAHAIRQTLGHKNLPDFVGSMAQVRHGQEP